MFNDFDRLAMTRALALAEQGLETTHPNPRVGCVIAKGDRIIAEGWHERVGEAHAEVAALRAAKEPVAGATAYVTLEPCSHHGRTPPCANALIEAGLGRVVFAVQDPNPNVSGKGGEALLRAGITVEAGLMEAQATELNVGFMKRMKQGLPWVRVKLAMSLDGRTALANGESKWITGEAAREDVQRWRARSSAILTGVGTVLADDPQLNVRLGGEKRWQPLRVVLDRWLRSPPTAKLFVPNAPANVASGASGAPGASGASSALGASGAANAVGVANIGGAVGAVGASNAADGTGQTLVFAGPPADVASQQAAAGAATVRTGAATAGRDAATAGRGATTGGPGVTTATVAEVNKTAEVAVAAAHGTAVSLGAAQAIAARVAPAPVSGGSSDSAPNGTSNGAPIDSSSAGFQARRSAIVARGAQVEELPADAGFIDLSAVLERLAKLDVNEVLVEAGPTLAGQLLAGFLADELLLYIAPKLLGPQGRPLVNLPELQSLQDAWGFSLFDAKRFGDDLRLRMRPK